MPAYTTRKEHLARSAERIPAQAAIFLATEPVAYGNSTLFLSMSSDGCQAGQRSDKGVRLRGDGVDQLALTTADHGVWVEESGLKSRVVSVGSDLAAERVEVDNAEFPVASPDGKWLLTFGQNMEKVVSGCMV